MINSPSTEPPTGTAALGWAPVRSVPAPFVSLVTQAEKAALRWTSQRETGTLQEWVESWERVHTHPEYGTAPLPFRLDTLSRLGIAYRARAIKLKEPSDFRRAEDCFRQGLEMAKPQLSDQAKFFYNLGELRLMDYQQIGSVADLSDGIELILQALAAASPTDFYLSTYRGGLARALTDRYDREGNILDLEEAILQGEEVLRSVEPRTETWALYLNSLGPRYRKRYLRTDSTIDLDHSIDLLELSVEFTQDQEYLPYRLTNLGSALLDRYVLHRRAEDLDRALHAHQKAVELTPEDHQYFALRQNNLGNSLSSKFHRTKDSADINATIKAHTQAVAHTLQTDPLIPSRLYNLGNSLQDRYRISKNSDDLKLAINCYRQACVFGATYSLEWMLQAAKVWGRWAMERRKWRESHEAFRYGLGSIDKLYDSQITSVNREAWLREARDLAQMAAYVLARRKDDLTALTILEQNRTLALNSALGYQEMEIKSLSTEDRNHLLLVKKRIQQLESEASSQGRPDKRDLRIISNDMRQARLELAGTIDRIHQYAPEFQPQGLDFTGILSLVETMKKPLVFLLTIQPGSLALVVTPTQEPLEAKEKRVHRIWLNQFTSDHLNEILFDRDESVRYLHGSVLGEIETLKSVLQEIWPVLQTLMQPISKKLRRLGYDEAILIPTGLLSLLPLHAVLIQQMTFSFVPSARALKSVFLDEDHVQVPPSLLGISNPSSYGKRPLKFADVEVREIEVLFNTTGFQSSSLSDQAAKRENVYQSSSGKTYLHFACHGQFDVFHPMESAIYLSDGDTLTLRNVMEGKIDVSGARLITLSACQTGIVDFRNVPDEVVGFPGGLIQASVPGIISTLWPVDDISTTLLMIQFYRNHLESHLEPSLALRAAQLWLRDATAQEMHLTSYYEKLARRDPRAFHAMQYFRKHPSEKPFSHPFYWAAFTFTGV